MPAPASHPPPSSSYSVYPLQALDGVLAYVALHGETVGFCFGRDERAAADAVAAYVTRPLMRTADEANL